MLFMIFLINEGLIIVLLFIILPLLFSTIILDILSALPNFIQKLLCFSPCIFLVATTIKLLFTEGINVLFLGFMLPFILLSVYGGFALIDILLSKNSK